MSDKLSRGTTYPLGDWTHETLKHERQHRDPNKTLAERPQLRAQWTGEKPRPILPGEWYLSGAQITAYCAPKGTTMAYCPARLVEVTRRVVEDVKPFAGATR